MGYPTSVLFTADGGENTISGIEPFTDAHIHDYKSGEQGSVLPTEGDFDRTARLFFYYHIIDQPLPVMIFLISFSLFNASTGVRLLMSTFNISSRT